MSEKKNTKILLFGDKRHRETRLRRSVLSIDDTDFLMEVRSARRRSIEAIVNDDILLSSRSPMNWNRVWNDFSISPDNIRNIFPLNGDKDGEREVQQNLLPDLRQTTDGKASITPMDESSAHKETISSNPPSLSTKRSSLSSLTHTTNNSDQTEPPHPAWYNRLGAMARRERQQEKAYHDTLDEHHKAKTVKALRQQQTHPYWRRKSSRDGLDFSRDVALAMRHNSIYAMADSLTILPPVDAFDIDNDDSENQHCNNGYIQDTRPAADPKTKKCVLDLIA